MRKTRSMPEIVAGHGTWTNRLSEIENLVGTRNLTVSETAEYETLETERHMFHSACTGHTPLNLIAAGFSWMEPVTHADAPGVTAHVLTGDRLKVGDDVMTVMEAALRVGRAGRSAAPAGWTGRSGRLGTLAGLENPPMPEPPGARSPDLFG